MVKKYYEFMKEITDEELYEGLLGFGMFSDKLPPFLTSKPFFDYCQNNNPTFSNTKPEQSYIYYENMRNINVPRPLGIPTPMSYQKLCVHLRNNWGKIIDHFEKNTTNEKHKISRIHIRKKKDSEKLFNMNYSDFKKDGSPEPDLLIGNNYVINADISTCFPSIYTHSLSWALVEKEIAKAHKGVQYKNEWYNELDFFVRNNSNGETHGILIGPHSSNLLSEIILTSIDFELSRKGWKYIRNIDDYTCYVTDVEEGQKFLIDLSEQLRKYKLVLNHKKTTITPLPIASTDRWVRKLNTYLKLTEKTVMDYKDVQAYLDLAIELMHSNNDNSAIINYTIKVLANKKLSTNATDYYIKTIFHLTIIYPYLVPLLEEHVFKAFNVEKESIMEFSKKIYDEGIKNNYYELTSYSIYYSLIFEFEIQDIDFDIIMKSNHCILLLLGFLYCEKNKLNSEVKVFKRLARELIKDKDDFEQNWLFVYEVLPKSSLKSDWKLLKDNNVSFIQEL